VTDPNESAAPDPLNVIGAFLQALLDEAMTTRVRLAVLEGARESEAVDSALILWDHAAAQGWVAADASVMARVREGLRDRLRQVAAQSRRR